MEIEKLFNELFERIKHGDQEHQDWLKNEIKSFVGEKALETTFKTPLDILKSKGQSWFSEDDELVDDTSFVSFNEALSAAEESAIEFANWKDKLSMTEKISLWSKDGQNQGIFQMDNEQLFKKFKKKQ